jgi:methyl-accepting chemotaxis protein
MSFKNLKLGTKLGVGFGVVLVLLSVLAYIGISRISLITGHLEDLATNKVPKMDWASDLSNSINIIARSARNIALSNDHQVNQQESVLTRPVLILLKPSVNWKKR